MKNTSSRIRLTAARVQALKCPPNKSQTFLWDTESPSLMLRATPSGRKTYAFEGRLDGQTIRVGIGAVEDWSLDAARHRAAELKQQVDTGQDPRELERQQANDRENRKAKAKAESISVGTAWSVYLEERRPHWGELHYRDHLLKAQAGGEPSKRRGMTNKKTEPGPLHSLMDMQLKELNAAHIEAWAATEGKKRPTSARLAWRLLSVFLTWCTQQPQYAAFLQHQNPAKTRKARESLGRAGVKSDVLTSEQLQVWFQQVRAIRNPVVSTCLQVMLLTGARPGEVLSLRWDDVNTQWKKLTIRDKVEGTREIPLTPYVASLLAALPHRNVWIFSSTKTLKMDIRNLCRRAVKAESLGTIAPVGDVMKTSTNGRISVPNALHTQACHAAGLEGLTLHGLRRSFASLTEWLEIPIGVVAQIQGHKPSATAEKHYKRRPLDLLRVHHERIEAWILEKAGVATPKISYEKD